jgi:hypothetical protein
LFLKKNGITTYTFPQYSGLAGDSLQSRMSESPRVLQHGSVATGDGKFDFRSVDIDVHIFGDDQADYFTKSDELKRHLAVTGQRLYINASRYINVDGLYKIKTSWLSGFYLVAANLTLTLKAYDPFFYDDQDGTAETTVTETATTENPHQFTITNPGNIDVPVVLTITAAGSIPSLTLKNVTDEGRLLAYADANFTAGKMLLISPLVVGGSVTLNGANTINNLSGLWLRLLPGDNLFEYVGGPCVIEAAFPVGWL